MKAVNLETAQIPDTKDLATRDRKTNRLTVSISSDNVDRYAILAGPKTDMLLTMSTPSSRKTKCEKRSKK